MLKRPEDCLLNGTTPGTLAYPRNYSFFNFFFYYSLQMRANAALLQKDGAGNFCRQLLVRDRRGRRGDATAVVLGEA